MEEFTNTDARGIVRGKCTGCDCTGYTGLKSRITKCLKCQHAPGKHEKVDVDETMETECEATPQPILHYDSSGHHNPPFQQSEGLLSQSSFTGGTSHLTGSFQWSTQQGASPYELYLPEHHGYKVDLEQQKKLPQCAYIVCYKSVHIEPSLPQHMQQFKYCSAACRDKDMQNEALKVTEEHIKSLEAQLCGMIDDHNLITYVTQNPGHCSRCFKKWNTSNLAAKDKEEESQSSSYEAVLDLELMGKFCARDVCKRKVHTDKGLPQTLQEFEYCSQYCRDKDMLDETSKNTTENIALLEAKLSGTVDNNSLCRYLEGCPGSCRVCPQKRKSSSVAQNTKNPSQSSKKEQESVRVRIWKDSLRQDLGIILCTKAYVTDTVHGFIVSGIKKDRAAYQGILKNKEEGIRLLDIIICVETIPVTPDNLSRIADARKSVCLECRRNLGIQMSTEVLNEVKNYTHVFAIRCLESFIGIKVQRAYQEVTVDVQKDSIAEKSGLMNKDIIRGFVMAMTKIEATKIVVHSSHSTYKVFSDKFQKCIKDAERKQSNLILFVNRTVKS